MSKDNGKNVRCQPDISKENSLPLIISASKLLQKEFPEPKFVVEGILPEGSLSLLTARPKAGKTYLALQMAISIALGRPFLLKKTTQVPVLFLSYELNARQVKKRLQHILDSLVSDIPPEYLSTSKFPLFFSFASRLSEKGIKGIEGLKAVVKGLESRGVKVRVIFIDTYVLFKTIEDESKSSKKSVYELESEYLAELRHFCEEEKISVVLIHHNRKKQAISGDVIEEIMGSTGIAGAVNNLFLLERKTGSKEAHLKVAGHDIEEQDIELTFDNGIFRLRTLEDKEREIIEAVVNYLQRVGQANQSAIIDYLKKKGFRSVHEVKDILDKFSQENQNFPTFWYVESRKREGGGRHLKIYSLSQIQKMEQKELFIDDSQRRKELLERVEALIESGFIGANEFPEHLENYGVYDFKTLVEKIEEISISDLEEYVKRLEECCNLFDPDEDYNFDF